MTFFHHRGRRALSHIKLTLCLYYSYVTYPTVAPVSVKLVGRLKEASGRACGAGPCFLGKRQAFSPQQQEDLTIRTISTNMQMRIIRNNW